MVDGLVDHVVTLVQSIRVSLFNPTRDWPAGTVSRLEYDLRSRRLNGMPIEAPIASAQLLGRADWFSGGAQDPDLDYWRLGLQVGCYEGVICNFRAIMSPESRASARDRAFRAADLGLITHDGSTHRLSARTTERDLTALLGPPAETGPIGGDRVHSFVVQGNLLESFHDPTTGLLLELCLTLASDDGLASASEEPGNTGDMRTA